MTEDRRITAVLQVIAEQARSDPEFLDKLERALERSSKRLATTQATPRRHRRAPAVVDPFEILRAEGEVGLRERLANLSLDELRDIVAEYRVEPYVLAMKWKTPSRLIDLIVTTIDQRSRKGEAFR